MKKPSKRKARVFRLVFHKDRHGECLVAIQEKLGPKLYRHIDKASLDPVYEMEVKQVLPKRRGAR